MHVAVQLVAVARPAPARGRPLARRARARLTFPVGVSRAHRSQLIAAARARVRSLELVVGQRAPRRLAVDAITPVHVSPPGLLVIPTPWLLSAASRFGNSRGGGCGHVGWRLVGHPHGCADRFDLEIRGLTPNERPWLEQELERLWGSSLVVNRGRTHELELELGLDWDSGAIALRRRRALWYRYRPSTKRGAP